MHPLLLAQARKIQRNFYTFWEISLSAFLPRVSQIRLHRCHVCTVKYEATAWSQLSWMDPIEKLEKSKYLTNQSQSRLANKPFCFSMGTNHPLSSEETSTNQQPQNPLIKSLSVCLIPTKDSPSIMVATCLFIWNSSEFWNKSNSRTLEQLVIRQPELLPVSRQPMDIPLVAWKLLANKLFTTLKNSLTVNLTLSFSQIKQRRDKALSSEVYMCWSVGLLPFKQKNGSGFLLVLAQIGQRSTDKSSRANNCYSQNVTEVFLFFCFLKVV